MVFLNVTLIGLTISFFWAGVLFTRTRGGKTSFSLAPLGLARPKGGVLAGIGLGLAVGMGAVFATLAVNAASIFVFDRLGYSTEREVQGPFMRGLMSWVAENPGLAIPAIVVVVVLFGPAVEELVFRGAVFNGLYRLGRYASRSLGATQDSSRAARIIPFALAALASSALFALLHLEPVLLPSLLLLAIVLCALFARTGSLLPPFVAHATFNAFTTTLIVLGGLGIFELPPV